MKKLLLIALATIMALPAAGMADGPDNDLRYNDVGNKIQCTCGCGQILIKCNHVGCQSSDTMIRQLRASLTNYSNDEDVLNWFRKTYGMTAVVAPGTHGFELTIWLLPIALVAIGVGIVITVTHRWRMHAAPIGAMRLDPILEDHRMQARKDTEI